LMHNGNATDLMQVCRSNGAQANSGTYGPTALMG
jgi:hypothetical protein